MTCCLCSPLSRLPALPPHALLCLSPAQHLYRTCQEPSLFGSIERQHSEQLSALGFTWGNFLLSGELKHIYFYPVCSCCQLFVCFFLFRNIKHLTDTAFIPWKYFKAHLFGQLPLVQGFIPFHQKEVWWEKRFSLKPPVARTEWLTVCLAKGAGSSRAGEGARSKTQEFTCTLSCKFLFLAPLFLFLSMYLGICDWNDRPVLIIMRLEFDMNEFKCK